MRLFLAVALFSHRSQFVWLTPAMWAAQMLIIPLTQVTFFALLGAYGGARPLDFYLLGNALALAGGGGFWIVLSVAEERSTGTLAEVIASPANRAVYFCGRVALRVVSSVITIVLGLGWASLLFGLSFPPHVWALIALAAVAGSGAVWGIGLALGAVALLGINASLATHAIFFSYLVLTGANIPVEELPVALQAISWSIPLTRSIAAARLFAAGGSLADGMPLMLGDLCIGLLYGVLGVALFRWFEVQARRRGTLEAF
jgi:ABC-2 type transport system permease protein